jgi:hypothetical protein
MQKLLALPEKLPFYPTIPSQIHDVRGWTMDKDDEPERRT